MASTAARPLDAGLLRARPRSPEEFLPPTAITPTIDTILAKVAVTDLAANQVLVEDMFVDPVDSLITAARRIADRPASPITISVDDVRGVAGLIVPGDFVNMMVVPADGCDVQAAGEGEATTPTTTAADVQHRVLLPVCARYLYQEVQVLFVDQTPGPAARRDDGRRRRHGGGRVVNTGLITVPVPPTPPSASPRSRRTAST